MTWHELFSALEGADPASEVMVVLYRLRGAPEVFALEEAQDTGEYVRLAIYEDEPVAEEGEHDTEGCPPMAQQFQFENVPIDEARRMSGGPRMDPELYNARKDKIQSLDNTATHLRIPEGTSVTTMKNRILRIAAELSIPVTIRKGPGSLLFWRSTEEGVELPQEVGARLQTAQRPGRWRRPGQRRRGWWHRRAPVVN